MRTFIGDLEIRIGLPDALLASHAGDCASDVAKLVQKVAIRSQLVRFTDDQIVAALRDYGAWSDDELKDRAENEKRLVWIAAGNIAEERDN
jgi:hypothetical protein